MKINKFSVKKLKFKQTNYKYSFVQRFSSSVPWNLINAWSRLKHIAIRVQHHAISGILSSYSEDQLMPKKKEPNGTNTVTTTHTQVTKEAKKPITSVASFERLEPAKTTIQKTAEKPMIRSKVALIPDNDQSPPAVHTSISGLARTVTVIIAKFDVGHGNNLYIRGDGNGLDWDKGVLMENAGGDIWQWTTTDTSDGLLVFKLLVNDETWALGENMNAPFGKNSTFYPSF